ncbi:MAG: hypothetical protein ACP5RF_01025 [Candidatus Micrarchaeia archaeon]
MPKYFKVYDSNEVLFITIDDSGAVIIKDKAGKKIFLSRYQAKLMRFSIDNLFGDKFKKSSDSNIHIEEISEEDSNKK